jgi:hypothetical protein
LIMCLPLKYLTYNVISKTPAIWFKKLPTRLGFAEVYLVALLSAIIAKIADITKYEDLTR